MLASDFQGQILFSRNWNFRVEGDNYTAPGIPEFSPDFGALSIPLGLGIRSREIAILSLVFPGVVT